MNNYSCSRYLRETEFVRPIHIFIITALLPVIGSLKQLEICCWPSVRLSALDLLTPQKEWYFPPPFTNSTWWLGQMKWHPRLSIVKAVASLSWTISCFIFPNLTLGCGCSSRDQGTCKRRYEGSDWLHAEDIVERIVPRISILEDVETRTWTQPNNHWGYLDTVFNHRVTVGEKKRNFSMPLYVMYLECKDILSFQRVTSQRSFQFCFWITLLWLLDEAWHHRTNFLFLFLIYFCFFIIRDFNRATQLDRTG